MSRPTKSMPSSSARGSKPWQMFPRVATTSRRLPMTATIYAPSPQPPTRGDKREEGATSGDSASEWPDMPAPAAMRGA